MMVIGLTGGIASGKSTVSNRLKTCYGAEVIDADAIAYELSQQGQPIWRSFVDHYGPERALLPDGGLNREGIGQIVFADPEERRWLDAMAHPLIQGEVQARLDRCCAAKAQTVVLDVPLLFEVGWESMADQIWVVYVDADTQLRRLIERNHLAEDLARQRVASQLSLEEKKQRADVVIDNRGSLADTIRQVDRAWEDAQQQEV